MLTYKSRSLLLHVLVLSTFMLPFYFTGCKKVAEADSTVVTSNDTTTVRDSNTTKPPVSDTIAPLATTAGYKSAPQNDIDDTPAQSLSKEYLWLKPILVPAKDTYTGLGILVNLGTLIPYIALGFTMFLLVFSLVLKMINSASTIVFIHSLTAFLFLLVAQPIAFSTKTLWGYWVCLGTLVLLLVHDGYGLREKKTKV